MKGQRLPWDRPIALLALIVGGFALVAAILASRGDTPNKPAATTIASQCAPPSLYLARGYPDPCLTPGQIRTSDPAVICQRGYATRVRRELTSAEWSLRRADVIRRYGLDRNPGEIDHLLPLSGGGANDEENLWPESAPQFKDKDAAEASLHAGICKPGVTVAKVQQLQQAFLNQWRG